MMRTQLITLCLLSGCALYGCSSIPDSNASTYSDPLCARVVQKMNPGTATFIPSGRTVTSTEQADLLQEYNQLGCHPDSDNRYAYPDESLAINKTINDEPVAPPGKSTRPHQ